MTAHISDPPAKKSKGRTPFIASPDQRATVASLAASRTEQADIARAIGISVPTLRKHFATELATRIAPDNLFTAPPSTSATATLNPLPTHPAPPRPPRTPRADGRKRWKPLIHQRQEAQLLIAANISRAVIARRLGITPATFRKAFAPDIATATEMQRADLLLAMQRTAKAGNVTAQHRLLEIINAAELDRIDADVSGKTGKPAPAPKPLGKKEQAAVDASDMVNDADWGDLISPARPVHAH